MLKALGLIVATGLTAVTMQPVLLHCWMPATVKPWLAESHCKTQFWNPVTALFPLVRPVRSPLKLIGRPFSESSVVDCWVQRVSLPPIFESV